MFPWCKCKIIGFLKDNFVVVIWRWGAQKLDSIRDSEIP